ncbi:MAG: DEAD/DEAH box helicase [Elusimicrobiaceae bacterium]|nr:DEAD/DEAH box helicase [Elusimicrobiaceae bacterium]
MNLYKHQVEALERTKQFNRVAYYHDMGLGKTFTGSEKMHELGARVNLVVCQKSKIQDWCEHIYKYYGNNLMVFDLTRKDQFIDFFNAYEYDRVGVINYDLIYRRPELLKLTGFTLMLDESSLIQNEKTQRAKFVMKLQYENLILLSGTPTSGRYERLYSQLTMLGYNIRKTAFFDMYVQTHLEKTGGWHGVPEKKYRVIDGYKNVEHLKRKMRRLGCDFLKTSEVLELPQQVFIPVRVPVNKEYRKFCKSKIVEVDGVKLKGDYVLKELLYLRQLAGAYSNEKLQAFTDLLDSTDDGLIVFYNFDCELEKLKQAATDAERPISIINGSVKDLTAYNKYNNAVVLVQYQAGAMGLNLQKYNKIVYYTPPVSSELYEQSKKRIHRINQVNTCFYYQFICTGSIEPDIYATLEMRRNYTDDLFKQNFSQYFV